jgi:hypothetical protein
MKQCNQCSKEFEPTGRGSEHIYCSKTCRSKAGQERYKKNLENTIKQQYENTNTLTENNEPILRETIERNQFKSINDNSRQRDTFNGRASVGNNDILSYVERCYEARTDAIKFELKYENALKEVEKLRQEIVELELAMEEEPEPREGFIGGITDLLEGMPEWLAPAVGKLLQSEKVQKFVISQIPEPQNQ